jgi:hypothetical protein
VRELTRSDQPEATVATTSSYLIPQAVRSPAEESPCENLSQNDSFQQKRPVPAMLHQKNAGRMAPVVISPLALPTASLLPADLFPA